jgi:hypothetical protein
MRSRAYQYFCALLLTVVIFHTARAQQTDTWHNVYEPNTSNNNFKFNNTAPFVNPKLWTNGNQNDDLNVSKVSVHTLLGSFTGKVYAHLVTWFDSQHATHLSPGYDSSDPAQVDSQIDDMISRGVDGVIVDWYGDVDANGNQVFSDKAALVWRDRILARGLGNRFVLGIMIDKGALNGFSDPTVRLNHLIHDYIIPTYENTMGSAYMKDSAGLPIIYFFNVQQDYPAIDWASVRHWASTATGVSNHIFYYQGANGFTAPANQADGAYAWVDARQTGSPTSYSYLSWWYGQARNNRTSIGSVYKGFNDSPVECWEPGSGCERLVDQHNGQTWLDAFQALREHPTVPAAIQLVTWNDYEEGTALEVGIDNGLNSINLSGSGSIVNWHLNWVSADTSLSTIHHFTVWARVPNTQTMYNCSGNLANTATSFNLSTATLPAGTYQIYVQAVGQPFIKNLLSDVPTSFNYTR